MTDAELTNLEQRLASLPAGPWRWTQDYGLSDGWHWCLQNDASAEQGATIDTYSVTQWARNTTGIGKESEDRICDTPVMSFLADSRALVDALLAEVKQWREVFANDCLVDSPALQMAHRAGEEAMRERVAKMAESWLRGPGGGVMKSQWIVEAIRQMEVQDP